ncbi:hypothetical protein [Actinomadura sp. K4S16]|uniref:hypothetical protein n=1 Tax=Actinomadura sp. K4S16 TaxID=1316147 RepID=UPI0011EE4A1F|nr:hypothetical protein [Actinomadura sp. K4S16]
MVIAVYPSGSIKKGVADEKKACWSDTERAQVAEGAAPSEVVFFENDGPLPAGISTRAQFGRDVYQVAASDVVVVDARERRGLGVGVEMAAAAAFRVPILVVAPRNTKYRADRLAYRGTVVEDYVHPHIAALATLIVDDFREAGRRLLRTARSKPLNPVMGMPSWLEGAYGEYRDRVLPGDPPMLALLDRLGRR